jgi:hypothetical protein
MMMGPDGTHSMDMGAMHSMRSMDMGASNMSTHGMKQGLQPMMGDTKMGIEKDNVSSHSSMNADMMSSDQGSK